MIQYPLTAKIGISGVWIEDATGLTLCDFNPLLIADEEGANAMFDFAEILVIAANAWRDSLSEKGSRKISENRKP